MFFFYCQPFFFFVFLLEYSRKKAGDGRDTMPRVAYNESKSAIKVNFNDFQFQQMA